MDGDGPGVTSRAPQYQLFTNIHAQVKEPYANRDCTGCAFRNSEQRQADDVFKEIRDRRHHRGDDAARLRSARIPRSLPTCKPLPPLDKEQSLPAEQVAGALRSSLAPGTWRDQHVGGVAGPSSGERESAHSRGRGAGSLPFFAALGRHTAGWSPKL